MLDRAHAGMGGAGDRLRRIGVGADVAAEGLRLLDGRGDLGRAELQAVERIVGGGDAARHHDLDVVGALAHLLARGSCAPRRRRRTTAWRSAWRCSNGSARRNRCAGAGRSGRRSGRSPAPAMNSRGPGNGPARPRVLMPQSAPPVSRTVVKPRSIMPRISRAARAVIERQRHRLEVADVHLARGSRARGCRSGPA